jgi:hypothetical protein
VTPALAELDFRVSNTPALVIHSSGCLAIFDDDASQVVCIDPASGITRRFGRSGSGPGELRAVRSMIGTPDGGLLVFDFIANLRFTLITRDWKLDRVVRVPRQVNGLYRPTRDSVLAGGIPRRAMTPGHLCVPPADKSWPALLGYLRNLVSNPRLAASRKAVMLPSIDPSLVQAVQSDSLCSLTVVALYNGHSRPDSASHQVYLVHVGNVYYAMDTTIRMGEYIRAAVLDSTLTKILSRPTH